MRVLSHYYTFAFLIWLKTENIFMNKNYEYKCIDESILTPAFRKHITEPVLRLIPIGINPNLITVISFIFSLLALFISYNYPSGMLVNTTIAILIFLYLLFDHLDGMQAKRKGGGSPLGEFLDHFFDVIINGVIVFTLYFLFDFSQLVLIITLVSGYIVQATVFLEQRQSGWLRFGKIEAVEAVVLLCFLILLSGFDGIRNMLVQNLYFELRLIDWLLIIPSVTGLKVIVESFGRIKWKIWPLSILILTILSIVYFTDYLSTGTDINFAIATTAILINQEYLIGHLTGRQFLFIDFLPFIGFIISVLFDINAMIVVSIIAGIIMIRFIFTVNTLSKYNPADFKEYGEA